MSDRQVTVDFDDGRHVTITVPVIELPDGWVTRRGDPTFVPLPGCWCWGDDPLLARLSGAAWKVICHLLSGMDKKTQLVRRKRATIAAKCGLSERSVTSALAELTDTRTVVTVPTEHGRGRGNIGLYLVNTPTASAAKKGSKNCALSDDKGSKNCAEREQKLRGKGAKIAPLPSIRKDYRSLLQNTTTNERLVKLFYDRKKERTRLPVATVMEAVEEWLTTWTAEQIREVLTSEATAWADHPSGIQKHLDGLPTRAMVAVRAEKSERDRQQRRDAEKGSLNEHDQREWARRIRNQLQESGVGAVTGGPETETDRVPGVLDPLPVRSPAEDQLPGSDPPLCNLQRDRLGGRSSSSDGFSEGINPQETLVSAEKEPTKPT